MTAWSRGAQAEHGAAAAWACARRPQQTTSTPAQPPNPRGRWDALPCDILSHALAQLHAGADRGAAALACRAWRGVVDAGVHDIRHAPLSQLPRLLERFTRASCATLSEPDRPPPPAGAVAAALLACPRPLPKLCFAPSLLSAAAALAALPAAGAAGAAWAVQLRSLELECTFLMALPAGLGAALPRLRDLAIAGFRNGGHGLEPLAACRELRALALRGVYCGELPDLSALPRLTCLRLLSAHNLREVPPVPAGLKVIRRSRAGRPRQCALERVRLPRPLRGPQRHSPSAHASMLTHLACTLVHKRMNAHTCADAHVPLPAPHTLRPSRCRPATS